VSFIDIAGKEDDVVLLCYPWTDSNNAWWAGETVDPGPRGPVAHSTAREKKKNID